MSSAVAQRTQPRYALIPGAVGAIANMLGRQIASDPYGAASRVVKLVKDSKKARDSAVKRSRRSKSKPAGKAMVRKAQTAPGRSGGRISSKTTVKRYKKTKQAKISRKGVVSTVQSGQVVTIVTSAQKQAIVLGHTTCPQQTMLYSGWVALFKHMIQQAGYCINDLSAVLPWVAGDQLKVIYRIGPGYNLSTADIPLAGLVTIPAMATYVTGISIDWNLAGVATDNIEFEYLKLIPDPVNQPEFSPVRLCFKSIQLKYYIQSHFKAQNRSVLGGDTESTAVDNVPLYGKTYMGNGTGPQFVYAQDELQRNNYVADNYYGNIIPKVNTQTTGDPALVEPPDPQMFDKCKMFGNLKLEPGEIKTSTLEYSANMKWGKFWIQFRSDPTALDGGTYNALVRPYGKWRMFALQKMIDSESSSVSIAVEHELKLCCSASGGKMVISGQQMALFTYAPPQPV